MSRMAKFVNAISALVCIASMQNGISALDNGLALTPPMGWLSWNAFGCTTDCAKKPTQCVSQDQIKAMADRIVADGYQDAGYRLVIVDDCWLATERDPNGRLQPDPQRFSNGIRSLADYMHSRSLKFGIYEDYGTKTCAGYPGSIDHATVDSQTFADWGVDYLKLDGCNANASDLDYGYPAFSNALNATGRQITYSCEWPLYIAHLHGHVNYTAVRQYCNLWRNEGDIKGNWNSLTKVIDFYDKNQDTFIPITGPGGWNDPDMLVAGEGSITVDQAKVQLALWSIWSAPLLISTDLRKLGQEFKKVLLNKKVIAVDQDPLGIMGRLTTTIRNVSIYVKAMTPVDTASGDHSYALAFVNRDLQLKTSITVQLASLGLTHAKGYTVENLFDEEPPVNLGPQDVFTATVNPTGVAMYKAAVVV